MAPGARVTFPADESLARLSAVDAFAQNRDDRVEDLAGVSIEGLGDHALRHPAERLARQLRKSRGWRLVSPPACQVFTDVMGSWRDLWHQRMRWQRGALENLRSYGFTRVTLRYWLQQVGMAVGVLALQLYLLVLIATPVVGHLGVNPFWMGVGAVFLLERLVTVWSAGSWGRLLAFPMVIEMAYDVFLQAVFVRSLIDIALRREARWGTAARRQTLAFERG